jgi:SAM-dependent methyltransferase
VLDLGSGPGAVALPLCSMENIERVACFDVDPGSREHLLKMRTECGFHKLEVYGDEGEPDSLPFESGAFDAVVCRYAFHHFPNPGQTMREMWRCLKTGGLLLYSDAAMPPHSRDATHALYRKRESSFRCYLTYHETLDLVASGGFHVLNVRPYGYQRGTMDGFLSAQPEPLKQELAEGWLGLDEVSKKELKWAGRRDGPFITYPTIDLAAEKVG